MSGDPEEARLEAEVKRTFRSRKWLDNRSYSSGWDFVHEWERKHKQAKHELDVYRGVKQPCPLLSRCCNRVQFWFERVILGGPVCPCGRHCGSCA
jgi:hypothetical protein